jgi:hypothetical protein
MSGMLRNVTTWTGPPDIVPEWKSLARVVISPARDAVPGRTLTSWPSLKTDIRNAGGNWVDKEVVTSRGLVTSRKPDDIPAFNRRNDLALFPRCNRRSETGTAQDRLRVLSERRGHASRAFHAGETRKSSGTKCAVLTRKAG